MTETERLLHNLVSATAVVAVAKGSREISEAERRRVVAVKELADHLDAKRK